MRALIDEYRLETVWAVAVMLLFLVAPARAQEELTHHFEHSVVLCVPGGNDCVPPPDLAPPGKSS